MLVAGGLIILGFVIALLAFGLVGFDWNGFNTSLPNQQKSYTYDLAGVSNLTVSDLDADVIIVGTDGDQIKIDCYENEKDRYDIQLLTNGNLSINRSTYKHWYEHIGFNFDTQKRTLTISVPRKFTGAIDASTMSGCLNLTDFDGLNAVNASNSSGDITLKNLAVANHVNASTMSGNFELANITTGKDLELGTASGKIQLNNGKIGGHLSASSLSGSMNFLDTTITDQASFENSSGNVKFDRLVSNNILISTLSGNVAGSILGDSVNYTVTADSLSGKIAIPNTGNGKSLLAISTASGNIDIEFIPVN